ncbi:MAG: ornithine carbamoyltransferase [Sulfolobaceae archaeon]
MGKIRHLICLLDYTRSEIEFLINLSFRMKEYVKTGNIPKALKGKCIALIFEKPSTRTRVSMEVAIHKLGGKVIVLNKDEIQLGRNESIEDTARVLGRYVNGIAARVLNHSSLLKLAEHSGVPVINMLSDKSHPLQALTDIMTIREKFGRDVPIAFIGDGRDNVLNSLMVISAKLGLELRIASPRELWPEKDFLEIIQREAEESGGIIEIYEDPYDAVKGVSVVYTDVWVSMGQENIAAKKRELLSKYRVTNDLMKYASKDAVFMHCLPAVRGEEVESEVIDGPRSIVWDQAENRLYTAMAVLSALLG